MNLGAYFLLGKGVSTPAVFQNPQEGAHSPTPEHASSQNSLVLNNTPVATLKLDLIGLKTPKGKSTRVATLEKCEF